MSAKKDSDDGDEDDYVDEGDDDEEEDFDPDADENLVDEYDDEGDDEVIDYPILDGALTLDDEQKLHYKGEGFHLQSTSAVSWNVLDKAVKPTTDSCTLEMVGPCDLRNDDDPGSSRKSTPRKMKVTWTVSDPSKGIGNLKSSSDDDDQKMPSVFYQIRGCEMSNSSTARMEFEGGYHPGEGLSIPLAARAIMAATHVPIVAAATATVNDGDEVMDADAGVDYDELIALHEDAGLSVDALRKRMRDGVDNEGKKSNKKGKPAETDDDDVEF